MPIDQEDIAKTCDMSKKELSEFNLKVYHFLRDYVKREKKLKVLQTLLVMSEQRKLGMKFFFQAKHLLIKLWERIYHKREKEIIGKIASLALIAQDSKESAFNSTCEWLGISPSTIRTQVQLLVTGKFGMKGYKNLTKFRNFIKTFLEERGLLLKN